jgi:hypothetical protein
MRQGAVPQPGQQPKVVDQDIAQMTAPQMPPQQMPQQAQQQLPENSGIGQLPAQNMQGMADGGIVGYAEGGHTPRYQGNNTDGSLVQLPGGLGILSQGSFGPQAGNVALEKRIAAIQANPRMRAEDKANLIAQIKQDFFKTPAPAAPSMYSNTGATSTQPPVTTPVVTPTATPAPAVTPLATNTATKPTRPVASTDTNVANPAAPAGGIVNLPSEAEAIARFKANINKNTETEVNKTDYLNELNNISRPAYDKATAMIEKEKGRLKEGKEQDFYMALIEGGLAAASEKGPNGIQNLAKGFSKGAASYRDALKDFRKGSQENAKMELELTRAEAAEKKGDIKTYYERMDKYKDRELTRDNAINQGIAQITNTAFSGQTQAAITQMDIASREKVAKMNRDTQVAVASMAGPQERLFATLGGGDVAKGLEKYQAAQTDKTGLGFAKLYVDHVAEANKAGTAPMSEAVFLDTMTRLASQFNPKTVTDPKQGNMYGRP